MMLVNVISLAVVSIRLTFGANIRTLPTESSCPRTIEGFVGNPHFECTASVNWVGDGFNAENCRAAIQRLYNVEVTKHGGKVFEFLLPGAVPSTSNPVMRTPRRYNVGQ